MSDLRKLLAGASERPWQWLDSGGDPDQHDELQDGRGEMVASGFRDDLGDHDGYIALTDGRLCAAAVNALPKLLRLEAAARAYRDHYAYPERGIEPLMDELSDALEAVDGD